MSDMLLHNMSRVSTHRAVLVGSVLKR